MLRFIPAFTWFIFITILFLLPGSELPHETWFEKIYLDKWVHSFFFFVLVWLFYFPLRNKTRKKLVRLVIAAIIYGLMIEVIQKYGTKDRSFDFVDIVFDAIGCIAAYFIGKRELKK